MGKASQSALAPTQQAQPSGSNLGALLRLFMNARQSGGKGLARPQQASPTMPQAQFTNPAFGQGLFQMPAYNAPQAPAAQMPVYQPPPTFVAPPRNYIAPPAPPPAAPLFTPASPDPKLLRPDGTPYAGGGGSGWSWEQP